AAGGVGVIERFRALERGLHGGLGLDEHAPATPEEHGDLARLRNLDDALAEVRVLDALADGEALRRAIRPHGLRQIRGDRGLLEPLDRLRTLRLRRRQRWLAHGLGRAMRGLVAVFLVALLAVHFDDLIAD